jgi:hypothetical protein
MCTTPGYKSEPTIRCRIASLLAKEARVMDVLEIADALRLTEQQASSALAAMTPDNTPGFARHYVSPNMRTPANKTRCRYIVSPERAKFAMPENLRRGWVNVLTGYTPEKLGL